LASRTEGCVIVLEWRN